MANASDRRIQLLLYSLVLFGLLLLVIGAIVTGIAFTEITPPNYDENYNRYKGSNISRIIGPFLIGFGLCITFSSALCFLPSPKKFTLVNT